MGLETEMEWTSKRYNTNMEMEIELTPPPAKNWPQFGSHMVIITLDGSTCKTCIISTSATYIWHTCEKVKKSKVHAEKEIDQ